MVGAVGNSGPQDYGMAVAKKALNVVKEQGAQQVKLIQSARVPVGGQGHKLNVKA